MALILRNAKAKLMPKNEHLAKAIEKSTLLLFTQGVRFKKHIQLRSNLGRIRKSKLFDKDWYLARNPDVVKAKIDPALHYLAHGASEGRDPSPKFSSSQYLASYDDVKQAGMNPLLHYLKYGRKEGRKISHAVLIEPFQLLHPEHLLTSRQLVQKLQATMAHQNYVLSISHDNYLTITGGVQVRISDEQISLGLEGISYLHLYPFFRRNYLVQEDESFYVGINCDGVEIGVTDRKGLLYALKRKGSTYLKDIHIHHTMGFDLSYLTRLANTVGKKSAQFWLHDYFSVCPGFHLLRNDREYCWAPDINSNACLICKYGKMRATNLQKFSLLFKKIFMEVISPSQYTLDLWRGNFNSVKYHDKVLPHVKLIWTEKNPITNLPLPINIGFVGSPVEHKGWNAWKRLLTKVNNDSRYKFYYFANDWGGHGNYERVVVSVNRDDRMAMVNALKTKDIDVAFLWSTWPETFSFTLFESLAAGCLIITNTNSGNIQDFITNNPERGMVLNNEDELSNLFLGEGLHELVTKYQKTGKPRATLVFPEGSERT